MNWIYEQSIPQVRELLHTLSLDGDLPVESRRAMVQMIRESHEWAILDINMKDLMVRRYIEDLELGTRLATIEHIMESIRTEDHLLIIFSDLMYPEEYELVEQLSNDMYDS